MEKLLFGIMEPILSLGPMVVPDCGVSPPSGLLNKLTSGKLESTLLVAFVCSTAYPSLCSFSPLFSHIFVLYRTLAHTRMTIAPAYS